MKDLRLRASTLALALLTAVEIASAQGPAPTHGPWVDCGQELMGFSAVGPPYLERIRIAAPSPQATHLSSGAPGTVKTPQRTRWFVLDVPDTTREGPWSTTMRVYSNPNGTPILEATFSDHHSYRVKATWLNDKLIFVEVPWGRLLATHIILDVESRKPVYMENITYVQCEQPTSTPS